MTEIDPKLVERMVELMRRLVNTTSRSSEQDRMWDEANAILAELPPPVDPDRQLAEDTMNELMRAPKPGRSGIDVIHEAIKRVRAEQQEAR